MALLTALRVVATHRHNTLHNQICSVSTTAAQVILSLKTVLEADISQRCQHVFQLGM